MTRAELFEEIRAALLEPQVGTVQFPYTYTDDDLIVQVRSALRRLRTIFSDLTAELSNVGVLDPEPTEEEGLLIALFVIMRLLRGDLQKRLRNGELGVYFRSGPDIIDTKDVARGFTQVASDYAADYETLLTAVISKKQSVGASVFGTQELTDGDNA